MHPHTQLTALCRRWSAAAPVSIAPLGTPGFSGSQVFVVELPDRPGPFVLKSFHAGASVEHARFVHGLVRHLRAEGIAEVPEVMPALDGDTVVVEADGRLWELARFMPGVAVPCPTPGQAAAATTTLARLHIAAAGLPDHPPRAGISPGIERRIDQASQLLAQPWQVRRAAWPQGARSLLTDDTVAALDHRVASAIAIFNQCGGQMLLTRVAAMRGWSGLLQPVLRDVWCDHVLFADERRDSVTAIVDFHAAGIDTPATDLARLLGSWQAPVGCERRSLLDRWPAAVAAYERVRPLLREEAELVPFLHGTGVLCGLDNWFRWTLEERRAFSDVQRVLDRIDSLLISLPDAIATAWSAAGNVD
jgi:Ser/Thr protein kinase RdoA (MazF antagonist)